MNVCGQRIFSFFNGCIDLQNLKHSLNISPMSSHLSVGSTNETQWEIDLKQILIEDNKIRNIQTFLARQNTFESYH
jgi:hypothetical protein